MNLPRAYGPAPLRGLVKLEAEDFVVEELLGFVADGTGEHDLLWIEKRGTNTEWLARQLARHAKVPQVAVGYAGLKDRQAVTRQAFTVQLPGRSVDWGGFQIDGVRLLSQQRHSRKLKRGALLGNRFHLRLRAVQGDREGAEQRLAMIAEGGVPNYFGAQRFGRDGANLDRARAWFSSSGGALSRTDRGFALSAARSAVFNAVLAECVQLGTWNKIVDGDLCNLDGRRAFFGPVQVDAVLEGRCAQGEIHPTGTLWGAGELPSAGLAAELERRIALDHAAFAAGLAANGLEQERRPLRSMARAFTALWEDAQTLSLSFELGAGAYATMVLHELLDTTPVSADDES